MDKIKGDSKYLEKKTIEYVSKKWSYLGLRYAQDRSAVRLAINDEIKMSCVVNNIENNLFPVKGKRILDVGCGIGGLCIALRLKGGLSICFDNDAECIKLCKLRASLYDTEKSFFVADVHEIPFPDKFFDIVIATGVLEHVRDPSKAIKEMSRVGRTMYIQIPNPLCPREGHYKIFWFPLTPKVVGIRYLKFRGFNPEFFEKYVHYLPVSRIVSLLTRYGMGVENITRKTLFNKINNTEQIKNPTFKLLGKIIKTMRLSRVAGGLYTLFSPSITIIAKDR